MRKNILVKGIALLGVLSVILTGCNKVSAKAEKAGNNANMELTEALEDYTADKLEGEDRVNFYRELSEEIGVIEVYDSADLTLEDLQNRNGKIIIEKCIGEVVSGEKDGKILNYEDPDHYYISYRSVEDCKVGDVILTYFIYNPDTDYEDDILERFDYIIDRQ